MYYMITNSTFIMDVVANVLTDLSGKRNIYDSVTGRESEHCIKRLNCGSGWADLITWQHTELHPKSMLQSEERYAHLLDCLSFYSNRFSYLDPFVLSSCRLVNPL